MTEGPPRRLLVVANRTESAPQLLEQVEQRARAGCQIALMVDCGEDAAATIGTLVERGGCDEILLSTPREHHTHWHRHDLPKHIQTLGIPVTVVPLEPSGWSYSHGFPAEWVQPRVSGLT
jgi:hypothetical protein